MPLFEPTPFVDTNRVELAQENLLRNIYTLSQLAHNAKVIPVLKSNAYGHGSRQIAQMLRQVTGTVPNDARDPNSPTRPLVELIAVNAYQEALELLPIWPGRVLVLGYIKPENYRTLQSKRLEYVIQSTADLAELAKHGRGHFRIHLEVNSGMNRLGLAPTEVNPFLDVIENSPKLTLSGVMTHLSSAASEDEASSLTTLEQINSFDSVCQTVLAREFTPEFLHCAATAGLFVKQPSRYQNTIRPGLGIYGANPFPPSHPSYAALTDLRPVLTLTPTVIKIHQLAPGERVGYDGGWWAKEPSRVAVLPLGYAEAVPYALGNRGFLQFGGQKVPIIGRICMNHLMLDITQFPEIGLGSQLIVPILSLAGEFGFSQYELLTRISPNLPRVIV